VQVEAADAVRRPLTHTLAEVAGLPGERPDLVMRFGRGPTLPFAIRRPVQSVVEV
jgi:hypothetical protein